MKGVLKLVIFTSLKLPIVSVTSTFVRRTYDMSSFINLLKLPRRHTSQITSLQLLRHGRRKQKNAFKRYLAKLRDETASGRTRNDEDRDMTGNLTEFDANINSQSNTQNVKTRFRARVAYCGTPFHGWQLQPGRSTVQGEIEAAFSRRFHRRIPVVGAGRTDSGVHARGQAIHFDLYANEIPFKKPLPPQVEGVDGLTMSYNDKEASENFCRELETSMNRMMSLDIRMFQLELAPYTWDDTQSNGEENGDGDQETNELETQNNISMPRLNPRPWHVIQRAESKWYSYRFALGPTLWNPMERFTRTHFVHRPSFASTNGNVGPYALTQEDIQRLQSILKLYEGTNDFSAFGGQLEQNAKKRSGFSAINTTRTVYKVELVKEPNYYFGQYDLKSTPPRHQQHGFIGEEGNYRIDFLLNGALYKMVRNMVGTAIEVWLGRMTEQQLMQLLRTEQNDEQKMGRKDNPCKPAPPEGLTLECVYYADKF
ncbi:hypothetical protein HJC23_008882 [Cyclotella cryptica]|uniref:tRNA pseudouridine synthase n=1 Tax=Cyclotella cryptica TaxID=29204 RepID=A0ABD3PAY7_9STRA|eukprot:CCRYP_015978-RA/>CCRYP_015978-RA protein AED:0.04 eAED:0.04 QI:504/1/1/1/0.5/0.33/3/750/482